MLATAVAYPLETADITGSALSGLPGPAERHFSASSSSTATTTTTSTTNSTCYSNATTATTATSGSTAAAHTSAVEHSPPVYANVPDAFGSQLPGQLPPANVPLQLQPQLAALSLRRRRSSKLSMAGGVRRTASSPNVRALAGGDATAAVPYPNTKGRNKLGYHRTSVACGHCRRRKIRCLLAPGDEQGRCSNCIRLKKECNFFPVEQQQAAARPPPLGHKPDPGDSSSASPSPPNQHGFASEHAAPFHSFSAEPAAPGSAPLGYPTPADARTRPGSVSSVGKPTLPLVSTPSARPPLPHMPTAPPPHSAGFNAPRPDRPAGWEGSPYMDQSPMSNGPKLEDPSANFWKLGDPMAPAAQPYSAPHGLPMIQHRESVSAYPYNMQRDEVGWSLPARSMSYSQLESMGVGQSGGYPASQEFKHPPPTALYPPPPPPPPPFRPSHFPPTPEPASAPPDGRPPHAGFAMHPPWNPSYTGNTIGGMSGKSAEGYGGWFSESNRLSQVDEEVSTGPMNEDAPSFYHHGTAQSAS